MPNTIDILDMNLRDIGGKEFSCGCGRTHTAGFENLLVGPGAIGQLPALIRPHAGGRILLVADPNTYEAAGNRVAALLQGEGFGVLEKILLQGGGHDLIPDEWAVGSIYVALEKDVSLIVAVGSGTINDLCRAISARTKIPYIIVATAPSMDGYASTVAPLIIAGYKRTFEAVAPLAVIADTDILKHAPHVMLCAGFGDIIGKYTALADWRLAQAVTGEYLCEDVVELVRQAIRRCVQGAPCIARRDPAAVGEIANALLLCGVAMSLVGNSRPASGAEHHFSHYWEMDAIAKGVGHPLHGNCVGAATSSVAYCYHALGIPERFGIDVPQPERIEAILRSAGAAANPAELGVEKELFHRSVLHALEVRPRYTILSYAKEQGQLGRLADELTERFYG